MKTVSWVIPPITSAGSGGLATLIDHAVSLSGLYNQTIYCVTPRKQIEKLYGPLPADIQIKSKIAEESDLMISTWWETAKIVNQAQAEKKAAFYLDAEQMFYPMSDSYLGVIEAQQYGFIPITTGRWLGEQFNTSYSVDFCADLTKYKVLDLPKQKAVCFLHQPDKPRRCARLGLEALRLLKKWIPDLTVYLYGSENAQTERDYPEFDNLGFVRNSDIVKLYNVCQLGICFSPTNPSRIPFEMFASGLPCLDLAIDNKTDFPDDLLYLGTATVEGIAQTAFKALSDPIELETRRQKGLDFMSNRPMTLAFDQFRDIIGQILC